MSDRQVFLDAIIAEPDRDDLRMIFADWLRDQGEHDRAEFIAVQCELANLEKCGIHYRRDKLRHDELRRRERELMHSVWKDCAAIECLSHQRWRIDGTTTIHGETQIEVTSALSDREEFIPGTVDCSIEWRRGFPDTLTCSWRWCRIHADTIRAVTLLRKVRLTTVPDDWPASVVAAIRACKAIGGYPGIEFELPTTNFREVRFGTLFHPPDPEVSSRSV